MGAAIGIALAIFVAVMLCVQIIAALGVWGILIVAAIAILLFYFSFMW